VRMVVSCSRCVTMRVIVEKRLPSVSLHHPNLRYKSSSVRPPIETLVRDISEALSRQRQSDTALQQQIHRKQRMFLDQDAGPSRPTRTEIMDDLCDLGIQFRLTPHAGHVRVSCVRCKSMHAYISPRDSSLRCIACGYTSSFEDYKRESMNPHRAPLQRITANQSESVVRVDPRSNQWKYDAEICSASMNDLSLNNKLPPMEELDSDLYDRVGYLNLMSQYEERERQRKFDEMENLRRLREDADKLSARDTEEDSAGDKAIGGAPMNIDSSIRILWAEAVDLQDLHDISEQSEFLALRRQLGVDRISLETFSRFHIKGHMDSYYHPALCYPRYRGPSGRARPPSGLKLIRKIADRLEKENYPEVDETGKAPFSGIFGFHMATASDHRIILTTNERDALAVYEATGGMLAVALPMGEKIDAAVLPYLEDFDTIYIWFPYVHDRHAKDYASYLNANRCYIVDHKERPIELVRNDRRREVNKAIREEAIRVRNKGFRSMIDVRSDLKSEIINSRTKQYGIAQWKRFDVLNKYLSGFRPGELTVLTGGTGFGKTTFLCEYSLDLLSQGVRTLFCSFEMPDEKILKWMLVQYAALPLYRVEHHPSVEMWLDRFERTKGDLVIMKVDEFRDKTISQIAAAIKSQVIAGGIQHVVIDNLQFLIGLATMSDEKANALERFNQQDRFVGLLRSIATDYGPHITLVVHPRKTDSDTDLDIQHFGGSARVTQEADIVFAIQRRRDENDRRKFRKFLYILKNRYGQKKVESDIIEMIFQPATYTHTLIDHSLNAAGTSK
uniref:SF4 helicase domain-containing protein n=2 Tax=Parascaris univalens TaxID=6257 RepID=A0A915AV93_PARUN